MEYGVILLLLKKRLRPATYSISFGLRKMFPNGDTSSQPQPQQPQHLSRQQQPQHPVKKRRSPGSPAGNAAAMLGVGEIEEQKPMVKGASVEKLNRNTEFVPLTNNHDGLKSCSQAEIGVKFFSSIRLQVSTLNLTGRD